MERTTPLWLSEAVIPIEAGTISLILFPPEKIRLGILSAPHPCQTRLQRNRQRRPERQSGAVCRGLEKKPVGSVSSHKGSQPCQVPTCRSGREDSFREYRPVLVFRQGGSGPSSRKRRPPCVRTDQKGSLGVRLGNSGKRHGGWPGRHSPIAVAGQRGSFLASGGRGVFLLRFRETIHKSRPDPNHAWPGHETKRHSEIGRNLPSAGQQDRQRETRKIGEKSVADFVATKRVNRGKIR